MGLFGSLFGAKQEQHPPLEASSSAARRLTAHGQAVESFVKKVDDRLELVPAEDAVYIFVGKPPGTFGVAWISGGEEHNLKRLVQDRKLPVSAVTRLSEQLRDTYVASMTHQRFSAEIAGRTVTVTPADQFASEVGRVIREVT
jgi:hypothetical protein